MDIEDYTFNSWVNYNPKTWQKLMVQFYGRCKRTSLIKNERERKLLLTVLRNLFYTFGEENEKQASKEVKKSSTKRKGLPKNKETLPKPKRASKR